MSAQERILVTGAAGGLGRPVARRLSQAGYRVTGLDIREPGFSGELDEFVVADISDSATIQRILPGQQAVVHFAGIAVPSGSSAERIFDVNVTGAYRLYEACAASSVPSVIAAGSINAIGAYFGVDSSTGYSYLPVDEDHPTVPSDPYSLSKHVLETIGDYFARRDGIGGGCLRIPVCFSDSTDSRTRLVEDLRRATAAYRSFDYAEFRRRVDRFRRERARERNVAPDDYMDAGDYSLYVWAWNLLCVLEVTDLAAAVISIIESRPRYFGPLHLGASQNTLGLESRPFARRLFPEIAIDDGLSGRASLVSTTKARNLIGWEPITTDAVVAELQAQVGEHAR